MTIFSGFCLPVCGFANEIDRPASLEISVESGMAAWNAAQHRSVIAHEFVAGIGLLWAPSQWCAVHGRISAGWTALLNESISYRFHNDTERASHLAALGLGAFIDVHPGIPVLTLRAELSASSYFVKNRAGIWVIQAGIGAGAQIDAYYFGVIFRFPMLDDFEKVFELKRKMPQIALQFSLSF